ncbi:MAG: TolC family protein [Bacteroidales bacterium]|nr:TolC family protein [Bacteroidales bacterium]MCF8405606.1 TolC family protein [Bacteroidales bacterium]
MAKTMKYIASILLIILSSCIYSQVNLPGNNTLQKLQPPLFLPPMDTLIEAAKDNSAFYAYYLEEIKVKQQELKITLKEWFDYVSFDGIYGYGMYDQLLTNQSAFVSEYSELTNGQQVRYYAGLSARLPLSAVFQRNNNKNVARFNYNKAQHEADKIKQEIANLVIEKYFETLNAYSTLIVRINSYETYKMHMSKSEKEFGDGKISLVDYTVVSMNLNKSQLEFETASNELNLKLAQLELLTGIKLTH